MTSLIPHKPIKLRHVLCSQPGGMGEPDIVEPGQWPAQRAAIRGQIDHYLGTPAQAQIPEPRLRVLDDADDGDYRRLKVEYETAPGEIVRAHLLIPPPSRRRKGAAVLCLHGTSAEGKDTQLGIGKAGRDFGRFLAMHGFITFSPDHIGAGERLNAACQAFDTTPFYERHPQWSAVGKAIWDGQRALDVMQTVPEVGDARLGVVGHSLGGHGAMFVAADDPRVTAAVSSCGLTTWQDNEKNLKWARDEWYVYIRKLRPVFLSGEPLPFDLHEFAALIAPRAFLNMSGMADETYGNNHTLPEAGRQLHQLWALLGQPAGFANFLFGAAHDVPRYSRMLTLGWFEHWLCDALP